MNILIGLPIIGGLLEKIFDRIMPDRAKVNESQSKINEAEVAGAGPSFLRLWRGFLGWVLSLVFVWEVVARPLIVYFAPGAELPPSMLKEVITLLLGMLGLS